MPLFYLKTVTYVYSLPVTYLTTLYNPAVRGSEFRVPGSEPAARAICPPGLPEENNQITDNRFGIAAR